MVVTPVPIRLLIVLLELGKLAIFAMVLFGVDAIRLILMIVPFMIVIVFLVVVAARAVLGYRRYWRDKSRAQQSRAEKTGSDCFHAATKSNRMATIDSRHYCVVVRVLAIPTPAAFTWSSSLITFAHSTLSLLVEIGALRSP